HKWQQYQQNRPQTIAGTPIDRLFPAHPSVAAMLQASGVHTIEQCADLSSHAMDTIGMGAQEFVNHAKKYLDGAKSGAGFHKMQKEMGDLQSENRVLKEQMTALQAQINDLRSGKANVAQMPNTFDVQAAQIAAGHPTAELAKRTRRK